ncbi:MAG: hypothetical protein RIQ89_2316 [Bacteroidota bacterium]
MASKTIYIDQVKVALLSAYFFLLPLKAQLATFALILLFVISIIDACLQRQIGTINTLGILSLLYFLIHAASLTYSAHLGAGLFDLQIKISFLIWPLLLLLQHSFKFSVQWALRSHTLAVVLYCIYCQSSAILHFLDTSNVDHFTYVSFGGHLHPTYFTMYIALAIIWLISQVGEKFQKPFLYWTAAIILCLSAIQLMSRMSLAILMVNVGIALFYYCIKSKLPFSRYYLWILIILGSLPYMLLVSNLNSRFVEISSTSIVPNQTQHEVAASELNNVNVRPVLWRYAIKAILKQPLMGVGVGSEKPTLFEYYQLDHFKQGLEHKLGPHNEYLQVWLATGIIGLITYLLLLFLAAWQAIQLKNYLLLTFTLMVLGNGLTESLLQVQHGVLFIAPFLTLFSFQNNE